MQETQLYLCVGCYTHKHVSIPLLGKKNPLYCSLQPCYRIVAIQRIPLGFVKCKLTTLILFLILFLLSLLSMPSNWFLLFHNKQICKSTFIHAIIARRKFENTKYTFYSNPWKKHINNSFGKRLTERNLILNTALIWSKVIFSIPHDLFSYACEIKDYHFKVINTMYSIFRMYEVWWC